MRANLILKSFACLAVAGMIAGCGGQKKKEEAAKAEQARLDSLKQEEMIQKQKAAGDLAARLPEEPIFDIVTNLGTIKVKLYSKTPKHRANFEKLAISGYFDSLLFHRVIDGFMIQGGDPDGTGMGGPGYSIKGEFAQNGVENNLVYWPSEEGTPQALTMLHNREIDMVVNIPKDLTVSELSNGYKIRRAAVDLNIPLITNSRLASAFIQAFCHIDMDDLPIKSWSEYK